MNVEPLTFITILGMAAVTYASRIGGLWLMNWISPSRRVEAWLRHLPGAILVSIIMPLLLNGDRATLIAALITLLTAARTKNILLSIILGVSAVWLIRQLG